MFSNKNKIKNIVARQILDSRGLPTLEVVVVSQSGSIGRASVPSGASTGKKEAVELRDGGADYLGKGVSNAIENINSELSVKMAGFDLGDQRKFDEAMIEIDGTENKGRLGGNATTGASIAYAKASASASRKDLYEYLADFSKTEIDVSKLPKPMFNLINGGLHASSGLDIQEYLYIPTADSVHRSVKVGVETYHALAAILRNKGLSVGVGDEGGFAPKLSSNTEPFDLMIEAASAAGYQPDTDFGLGIDAAANSFVVNIGKEDGEETIYELSLDGQKLNSKNLIYLYEEWVEKYHLLSIEDGLCEEDLSGWKLLTGKLSGRTHLSGRHTEVIGDDLFVTSARKLISSAEEKLATATIIKPNQVGTLTETMETVRAAKSLGMACIASHRSGDTIDDFISDVAVGFGCEYLKSGAPARGERVSKYNRLMEIEMILKDSWKL